MENEVWQYLGGICRAHGVKAVQIGGMEDHVHLLLGLPSTMTMSDCMKRLKGESSKWISATYPALHDFHWQDGYGAFSLGQSQLRTTVRYIKKQREHHHRKTFEEEYRAFLHVHDIEVEEKYIFG